MTERALDRLTSSFLLSWVRLTTPIHEGDILLLMTLSRLFAASVQDRPIPASAIARSLGLPRRTVPRKAKALAEAGWASRLSDGFVVEAPTPANGALLVPVRDAVANRAREYLCALRRVGVSDLTPSRFDESVELSAAVFYATNQLCLDLLVQVAGGSDGDPMLGVAFLAVCDANTRHLDEGGTVAFLDFEPTMPDEVRRPISMLGLAEALGAPRETARRYANRLVAIGWCKLVKGGLIVNESLFSEPAARAAGAGNRQAVARFLSSLAVAL